MSDVKVELDAPDGREGLCVNHGEEEELVEGIPTCPDCGLRYTTPSESEANGTRAVPISEQAQHLRDHYARISLDAGEWCNQIPVAIDLWERQKLRDAAPTPSESEVVERLEEDFARAKHFHTNEHEDRIAAEKRLALAVKGLEEIKVICSVIGQRLYANMLQAASERAGIIRRTGKLATRTLAQIHHKED